MLQQTTVAAVTPRFERFVARWPTIDALAAASDDEILSEWAGLGYYARARNLIACARQVARRGGFPTTEAELRKLPGIGDYTAAAIAAIAFGDAPRRSTPTSPASSRGSTGSNEPGASEIRAARRSDDSGRSGRRFRPGDDGSRRDHLPAQGARLRRLVRLARDCVAFASGTPEAFPAPKAKRGSAAAPRHRLLDRARRRGVAGAPAGQGLARRHGGAARRRMDRRAAAAARAAAGHVRHVFTHFALDLAVVPADEPDGDGWWQPLDRLDEAGLPTLYRRAAASAGRPERRPPSRAAPPLEEAPTPA